MTTLNGLVGSAVAAMFAVALLLAPVHSVEETETYFTIEALTHQQRFMGSDQVKGFCFPWFCEKTEIRYLLRNTDAYPGEFNLNFVFRNASEVASKTVSARALAGEEVAVVVKSPIKGHSEFTVNVLAPTKSVPHERTVVRNVNTLSKLPELLRLWRFR